MAPGDHELAPDWVPPSTLEERIVNSLIPPPLYWRIRAYRALAMGEAELRILKQLVDPARTSVDVGANKGVYTYFLSRYSRHVHAYEPNPKILRLLRRSARARNVTISGVALSDTSGEAVLSIPKSGDGFSNQRATLRADAPGDSGRIRVTTRRLDDEPVGEVGFIKIDVEGFEMEVLAGARETIRRHRPAMLIEIEEIHLGSPIAGTLSTIEAMGYRGMFLQGGALKELRHFDPAIHHDQAARDRYVFNFVFLPVQGGNS